MSSLNTLSNWEKSLGLLPIKLFSSQEQDNNFIMLNGGEGDFCMRYFQEQHLEDYFSLSWSSNTKNYVSIEDEKVRLYNWQKKSTEEITKKYVEENLETFYKYLSRNSFKSESDIVPFVISIYRKLRNLTQEKDDGAIALRLLFTMFALKSTGSTINQINFDEWGLDQVAIDEGRFMRYFEDFSNGVNGQLEPNIELIIRHTSGVLFQETQKEALLFNAEEDLFGMVSGNYQNSKKIFSSSHYTPAFIARSIVEETLKSIDFGKANLKILDPACGTSNFLMEVLKQLKSKNFAGNVEVHGWDISESAITTSRFLLQYESREWEGRLSFDLNLVEDSLTSVWDNNYDLILMNPPYVSWELMSKQMQEGVKMTLGDLNEKRPNQASAFLYKCITSLSDDGVLGCVVPASLLTLDSYSKLRNAIRDIVSFTFVAKLGSYIFDNALTDVTILVAKKPHTDLVPNILWTRNEKGIATDALRNYRRFSLNTFPYFDTSEYSIYKPNSFAKNENSWKPVSYVEHNQILKIESLVELGSLTRIENIFNVKQGIRTGNNNVFKISSEHYNNYISENEQKYFRPVVDNESIQGNRIFVTNYVWYPYDSHGLNINSEEELIEKVPEFYNDVLRPKKEQLEGRAGITHWWALTRPRNWQYDFRKRLVSTEFGNASSFAFDGRGQFVIERGNAWIPKKEIKSDKEYFFYLSLFASPFFNKLLSIYSKQLAGGKWYDLGNKYTDDIPIPIFSNDFLRTSTFEKLSTLGKKIYDGDYVDYDLIDFYLKKDVYLFD